MKSLVNSRLVRGVIGLGLALFGWMLCEDAPAASFSNAIPLITARGGQTATLLTDGKLLVAGGQTNGGASSASAELYDPTVGTWASAAAMNADRAHHTATMLPNGQVLVAGGFSTVDGALSSAELYDPLAGAWTVTGSMASARYSHTATLLANGQVLLVGGTKDGSNALSQAELYDPATGSWAATNSLMFPRLSHTATLLANGQVLIAGGTSGNGGLVSPTELYDPATGVWMTTNAPATPRLSHTATLLPTGVVLIAGGTTNGTSAISSVELYNPATGTWTATNSLNAARFNHTATLLPNGSVLVTGGAPDGAVALTNAEVFNPGTGNWNASGVLNSPRYSHTATLLPNGEVLVVGGFNTNSALSSVERYDPAAGAWTRTGSMTIPQNYLTQTLLGNGKVLVLGGGYSQAELYDPASGTWTATTPMSAARFSPSVTLLPNGKVLVAGGNVGANFLPTAELYDPVLGTWTATGSMHQGREYQTATLLPGGNVLVAGGITSGYVSISSAELYNPSTGTWTVIKPLTTPRGAAAATLLANGKVLVIGGFSGSTNLTSTEIYDPVAGTWTPSGPIGVGREDATATLLLNGTVLLVAGYGSTGAVSTAELYDPMSGTWTTTEPLPGPRYYHSATLLPNGKTLIAGGSDGRVTLSSCFLYDTPTGKWHPTASLLAGRAAHAASLLPSGKVLVAGGSETTNLSSAELYDPGLGFASAWQPQVTSVSLLNSTSSLTVLGAGFRGVAQGSGGNTQDSPADYPVLELLSVQSDQTLFPIATNWSDNSIVAPPVSGLPPGYLLATVFVNGIPSAGSIFKIPTLPQIANLPATLVGATSATLNGRVLDTGGNTPSVILYYGPSDGGTNALAWSNSIPVGLESGQFLQALSGLATNTTYYFTAKAVNVVGAVWATPSQSFTTVTLPTLVNLPATGVQDTFATLNGQVLSTGHQTPTVTIYYGTQDGGANAAAWEQNVPLGLQAGAFSQTVNDLSTNTTYYFRASAENAAGAVWATPSLVFKTTSTNSLTPPSAAVLTQHNDNGRTGMNLNELLLNVGNVNTHSFGLLYTRPVDDQIYAQPLVATNVHLLGHGTHNVVILATVNDTVYAFDADRGSVTEPYWTNSFLNPPNIVPPNNTDESAIGACGGAYQDYSGNFGIVGTPVIDPVTGTIYLVARTREFGTNFVQRLHALDITTGLDRTNSPVVIRATYAGSGAASSGGTVSFDPLRNNQRPALALVNGVVYVAWSSHCDNGPYHGWVIGYNAATLAQVAVFNTTPNGSEGGVWMSGQGPSADAAGNIYLSVGNGSVDANDYGESFLKLSPGASGTPMKTASYFIPTDWPALNGGDVDFGSAGLLLIPGTTFAISGGKQGILYLVNRDTMGGVGNGLQTLSLNAGEIHGGPVWWTGPNGSFMYVWPDTLGHLRQYQFNGSFNPVPYAQSTTTGGNGSPGGILAVSANGTNAGTGILWATVNTTDDANHSSVAGTLHAYNAQNVGSELWNSDMVGHDALGSLAKFVPPTVANGKVYVATFSGQLDVYGLFPVATNLVAATLENHPMSIANSQLLALSSDAYGFPLAVTGVSPTSTNGGSVTLSPSAVTYLPVSGYVGMDRFTYTVGDEDSVASASVLVQVLSTNTGPATLLPPFLGLGDDAIVFAGSPGLTYTVQRAASVQGPWNPIGTVTVGSAGIASYVDSNRSATNAFYRITYP